jgi:DNA-binding transcriptional MocR family regulator
MTIVWSLQTLNCTQKMVLLALADSANDEGGCWPSIPTVCQKASLSERAVQNALRQLINLGLVHRRGRVGHSNYFTVCEEELQALHIDKPVDKYVNKLSTTPARGAPTPARRAPPPPHVVHPESSSEPSKNLLRAERPLETVFERRKTKSATSRLPGFESLVEKLKT